MHPIVTEIFTGGRKLNTSLVFITQSSFALPKNIRLNFTSNFTMEIPKKRELQQIKISHWLADIGFKDFMIIKHWFQRLYEFLHRIFWELMFFLVNGTIFVSGNPLQLRRNLLERKQKLIKTIDDKTRYEKLQYSINREGTKRSALSSRKIDKYQYHIDEEVLPFNHS